LDKLEKTWQKMLNISDKINLVILALSFWHCHFGIVILAFQAGFFVSEHFQNSTH